METFREATAIADVDGQPVATIPEDYCTVMGAFGGYLAALALRAAAAGAASFSSSPTSLHCQFLRKADPGRVELVVGTRRRTARAEALVVTVTQGGGPVLIASTWFSHDDRGLDYAPTERPAGPPPSMLVPVQELYRDVGTLPFVDFRPIFEPPIDQPWPRGGRPWSVAGLRRRRPGQPAAMRGWVRLRPVGRFDDPVAEATRALVAVDALAGYVTAVAHAGRRLVLHTSTDLYVAFHGSLPSSEWLYAESSSPVARGGIAHVTGQVWAQDGHLLVSGAQQMVQRVRL